MADFKNLLFGFILTSLFAVMVIGAAVSQGTLYGRDTSPITGNLDYLGFNRSISTVSSSSQDMRESFEKQSIWSVVAGIVVTGIFDITKTMAIMIILPFTLISNILTNVMHIPSIVTNVIMGLLILSILFGIWKLLKIGE